MIRINQIKLHPHSTDWDLNMTIQKKLKRKCVDFTYTIAKQSIDSRNKPDIQFICAVDVTIDGVDSEAEKKIVKMVNDKNVMYTESVIYKFPECNESVKNKRIVIVGSGPAGLYCGLMLAKAGFKPLIIERGADVDARSRKVEEFWNGGELDTECNVQFGEGGAGTFSDGKLNTQVKDPSGRIKKVLEVFVDHGAPAEILYSNKPHIGTDILVKVVKNIRKTIINNGGEFRFNTKLTDLEVKNGAICGIEVNNSEKIPCDIVVLAIGHSARDTFEMLLKKKIDMIPKAFAVGVRIEHPQTMINEYAYGENIYELPSASYKVTYKADEGRGVYSFCMCPGGYVVNASSEPEKLCINGMSYSGRNSANANSAIVVTVTPADFGNDSPLSGVEFQRKLEAAAFRECDGKIPCQTFGSFKANVPCKELGTVVPCTKGESAIGNLRNILPEYICEPIVMGIKNFARQIPGFDMDDAVLLAVEARTSSPVRIVRDDNNLMSNILGLMPCGEGAGYAGGITSAAVDGIRVAEAIVKGAYDE